MSRRHAAVKREVLPDAKYGNKVVSKFINNVMERGKKSLAEKIVYGAIEKLQKTTKTEGVEAFLVSMKNAMPLMEVKARRIGGATYPIPMEVNPRRAAALAHRWVIAAAKKRPENTMVERLAAELNEAYNNRGGAIKKRDEVHKAAEANKAFAHYKVS
jgi:small subunit ribosomal protein S7